MLSIPLLLSFIACGDKDPAGDSSPPVVTDEDGDGFDGVDHGGDDCDDADASVNPGADELCDGFDNNCDGTVDEDTAADAETWYQDADGDGVGVADVTWTSCEAPSNYVAGIGDCDDNEALAYPGADEICDGIDNNCNGTADENSATDAPTWYTDNDNDGYGDANYPYTACEAPAGYVDNDTDCNDTRSDINLDGTEVCDELDNDCDGDIDEDDAADASIWYVDSDGDGYGTLDAAEPRDTGDPDTGGTEPDTGDPDTGRDTGGDSGDSGDTGEPGEDSYVYACEQPSGYADNADDCDDSEGSVNPDGIEVCDTVDNDCDGEIDGSDSLDATTKYYDSDRDNYGDPSVSITDCTHPAGYIADNTDCDDTADSSNPGADEICEDSADNDCDGITDECAIAGDLDASTDGDAILGMVSYDYAASGLGSGADVDGDGTDDFAIGVPNYDDSYTNNGGVFVFYGGTTASDLTGADFYLSGPGNSSGLGEDVWVVDDLVNDGSGDVVVSGPNNDLVATNGGSVWIHSGPTTVSGTVSGYELYGSSSYLYFGEDVTFGDLGNDGYEDVIVGAPGYDDGSYTIGAVYVFNGPVTNSLAHSSADIVIVGDNDEDEFGCAVASLGDNDGDGVDDLAVGGHYVGNDAGAVWVFHGPWTGTSLDGDDADGYLTAEASEDLAGNSVAAAGDHDGDGYGDILVGAPYSDADVADGGATYLVLGPTTTSVGLATAATVIEGSGSNDQSGSVVMGGFDADGDGNLDIAVSAPNDDDGASNAGAVYLFYGPLSSGSISVDSADATIWGSASNDSMGSSVAAGDLDGDGYDDLLTGARKDSTNATYAGAAYLFWGDVR